VYGKKQRQIGTVITTTNRHGDKNHCVRMKIMSDKNDELVDFAPTY